MAKFEVNGLDALIGDLEAIAKLPDSVGEDILNAEADIVEAEQRKTARDMLKGPYTTGKTESSIKRTKVKKTASGKALTIYPQGTRGKGKRAAEVAFINEYGKRGQPARPFIRVANERAEPKAAKAGEKVYGDFLNRHGL